MYGVQPSGFVAKPQSVIKAELDASMRATFGPGLLLTPQSSAGQFIGIMSDRLADLWAQLEAVYAAAFPDSAAGVHLDHVASITGTVRSAPSLSKVRATLTGTPGTVIPAGTVASILDTGTKFQTTGEVTLGAGGALADVLFVAVEPGPFPCYAGTLTVIETPVAGWDAITNPTDHFFEGAELESDVALRLKRERELRSQGNAALEAIREKVRKLDQVTECYAFENVSESIDTFGLPPHSVEVLVRGGNETAIRSAIFASKGGGIRTHGDVVGNVADKTGKLHEVRFSRPVELEVWATFSVTIDPDTFPFDGIDQIKKAAVDYANRAWRTGSDVISAALGSQAFKVSGVIDCPAPLIGIVEPPASAANIVTSPRELPVLDTARIVVNLV